MRRDDGPAAEISQALETMKRSRMEKVVARLQSVMDQAMRGEVCAVAIATVGPDLSTGSAWSLGDKTLCELLGSISLMHHKIMTRAEGGPLD